MPIGGASAGEGLRLQPAQQACLLKYINIVMLSLVIGDKENYLTSERLQSVFDI